MFFVTGRMVSVGGCGCGHGGRGGFPLLLALAGGAAAPRVLALRQGRRVAVLVLHVVGVIGSLVLEREYKSQLA